ncbi:uncharacterized protein LOC110256815, partial [Sus scrofa]|uniref:uncharacterized protein LOC110256815 n=1 Tax=Sus scrofa TaxID=9823 RepID=UPI000A2B4CA9
GGCLGGRVPRGAGVDDISAFSSLAATQSPSYTFPKKKPLPSILSKSSSVSHLSNPWQEELVSYLKDQAVSLLIYKHKFEKNLTGQLGFISFPVTEALMDLFLGFKRVKGSRIHLSSKINWSCLLRRLEEAQSSQQVSQRATRWVSRPASQETSQHNTPQRSPETPTVQPQLATRATKVQDKTTEPHLDTGLLLTPQENAVDAGQEPSGFPEPKVSTSADTSVASHLSKQKVDKKDKQSIEEEVKEEELEEAATSGAWCGLPPLEFAEYVEAGPAHPGLTMLSGLWWSSNIKTLQLRDLGPKEDTMIEVLGI